MKNAIWMVAVLSMALAGAACGDSSDGGGAGSGGSSATGGTGGTGAGSSGDACSTICNSPCVDDVSDFTSEDIAECEQGCGSFFQGCESETVAALNCFESVNCDEDAAASQCTSEGIAFAECLSGLF